MDDFPNVLIVSESPFCVDNGFGVTKLNLFQHWPSQSLAILHTRKFKNTLNDRCFKNKYLRFYPQNRKSKFLYNFGILSSYGLNFSIKWLKSYLQDWKPEIIYSFVSCFYTFEYTKWLKENLSIPVVIHFADDFPQLDDHKKETIKFLLSCQQVFCVSDLMKEEYYRRYNVLSKVLHNGATQPFFYTHAAKKSHRRFKIRYLGTLQKNAHFESIEDIVETLLILNRENTVEITFEIFGGEWTAPEAEKLARCPFVYFRGAVSHEKAPDILKSANLLLIPITFCPINQIHYKFSFPTKFAQYLATGTPTLIYGPTGSALVEYCVRHSVGIIQKERSVNSLKTKINSIINNYSKYADEAISSTKHVKQRMSATGMKDLFQNTLIKVSS
jgi:hypothetical protein